MYKNIGAEEAKRIIEQKEATLLDVRLREDYEREKIPGAINIFFGDYDFDEQADELPKGIPYIVYCKVGVGSLRALDLMGDLGFESLYNMSGGIDEWKEKGYETE